MTTEEECLECKWCNYNQPNQLYVMYHQINPFTRLYVECTHPKVYWVRNNKQTDLPCMCARADAPDTETVVRCGKDKKYFQPR
jgi:hypothetical protein